MTRGAEGGGFSQSTGVSCFRCLVVTHRTKKRGGGQHGSLRICKRKGGGVEGL